MRKRVKTTADKYRTLAANTVRISIGTFGSKLLIFLMVRFYTGYLTPAEYGTADLITQTANLLIPLISLDIADGVFRFAADRLSAQADAFSVGIRLVTCGSAVLFLAVTCLREMQTVHAYGFLLAGFVSTSCYHAVCAHFVRARGDTALFAVQGLVNTALFIGLNVLFLAVLRLGIYGYVLSTVVANVLTTAFIFLKARLWHCLRFFPDRGVQRQMLRYSLPLVPGAIFWWIMGVSDRYMLNWFLGSEANGIYAVAYKIPTALTILASVFMNAWQLSAIAENGVDRQAHLRFYGKVWEAFSVAVMAGTGCVIAFSPLLIRLLADEPYFCAWQYIPMLALSMAAAAFSNFFDSVYVVTKKSVSSLWTSLAGAAINILLNLVLIPRIGIQGAAAATFVSCFTVFLLRLADTRHLLPFPISAAKLVYGAAVLLIQTAFILFRLPGRIAVQAAGVVLLLLLGFSPICSTLRVIFHRK